MTKLFKQCILFCLRVEARLVLWRHKPVIIGVTGSVGKTSAKEAIAALFAEQYEVWKSPKSYNSEIGVPLAILGLASAWNSPVGWIENLLWGAWRFLSWAPYPQILVLEMGIDRPGDFDKVLGWIKPDIAVVTTIGDVPVHVEFFNDPEDIAREKKKLVHAVSSAGCVVLNADDALVLGMRNNVTAKVITYGTSEKADIRGSAYKAHFKRHKPDGISFHIDHSGKSIPVRIPEVIGPQNMYSLLAAAATGVARGMNLIEIAEGLAKFRPLPGRFRVLDGIKNSLIIDDSYNASPIAMEMALETLASMPAERKIAALGDMLELGKFTVDAHRIVGQHAARSADVIVAVGLRAKYMESEDGKGKKEFHWFASSREAADFLKDFVQAGDVVLVKGSQSVRMERISEALLKDSEKADELLVRQDAYWKKH